MTNSNENKISILITAYNVEKYIADCLESVKLQSYPFFEVIIIDDGSTDKTHDIIKKKFIKDKRFRLISIANGGVAAARNIALSEAKGEYIIFLDSDDKLHIDCLKYCIENIKDKDILFFNYFFIKENLVLKNKIISYPNSKDVESVYRAAIESVNLEPNPWGKMYKKSVFNDIKYPTGLLYEDYAVFYKLMSNSKVIFSNEYLYYYRIRNGSIMRGFSKKHIDDKVYILSDMKNKLDMEDENIKESFINSYVFHLVFVTTNIIFNKSKEPMKDILYLNKNITSEIFTYQNILKSKILPFPVKVYLLLYKLSPFTVCSLKRINNRRKG